MLASIEAILFVASTPLSYKALAKATDSSIEKVAEAVETLAVKYNHEDSGIHIFVADESVQMGTNPTLKEVTDGFVKSDIMGELTRAQLETLTVIAYRGPVTRPEMEQIRGVNCAVIVRNLLMRGLIQAAQQQQALMESYVLTIEALAHLGVTKVEELPDYEALSDHEYLKNALEE